MSSLSASVSASASASVSASASATISASRTLLPISAGLPVSGVSSESEFGSLSLGGLIGVIIAGVFTIELVVLVILILRRYHCCARRGAPKDEVQADNFDGAHIQPKEGVSSGQTGGHNSPRALVRSASSRGVVTALPSTGTGTPGISSKTTSFYFSGPKLPQTSAMGPGRILAPLEYAPRPSLGDDAGAVGGDTVLDVPAALRPRIRVHDGSLPGSVVGVLSPDCTTPREPMSSGWRTAERS
jgi:hypothetical protein